MPSATDLITYIGVPLTVLGLLPIFWNIFLSLLIRYRLSASIPSEFRHFFDLIADPANGDVILTFRIPLCNNPGLWPAERPPQPEPVRKLLQLWRHKVFLQVNSKIRVLRSRIRSTYDKAIGAQLDQGQLPTSRSQTREQESKSASAPTTSSSEKKEFLDSRRFSVDRPRHLFRPWMTKSSGIAFSLDQTEESMQEYWQRSRTTNSTVNITMEIPETPRLAMPWRSFAWFALALGADPYDFDFGPQKSEHKLKCNLRVWYFHEELREEPFIHLSKQRDDWNVALTHNAAYDFSVRKAFAWNNIMCFYRGGSIICRTLAKSTLNSSNIKTSDAKIDVHGQGELCSDFFSSLASYGILPDHFPLPQCEDDTFFRALYSPKRSPKHAAAITWIFYLEGIRETGPIKYVSQGLLNAQEKSLLALSHLDDEGLDDDEKLEEKMANIVAGIPDPLNGTIPIYETSSGRIRDGPSTLADRILGILRFEFKSSSYCRKAHEFLETIRRVIRQLEDSSSDLSAAAKRLAELERQEEEQTFTRSPEVISDDQRSERLEVLYALRTNGLFSELEKLFNPHKSENSVDKWYFPTDEVEFLAHIILVLQDWQGLRRIPWKKLQTFSRDLYVCLSSLNHQNPDPSKCIRRLKKLGEMAKKGVFDAPWDGVVESLLSNSEQKFPRVVYFV